MRRITRRPDGNLTRLVCNVMHTEPALPLASASTTEGDFAIDGHYREVISIIRRPPTGFPAHPRPTSVWGPVRPWSVLS
jgi:hypothetical protein